MPEPDSLIHGGGEDEEVVGPGDIQQVASVPYVQFHWSKTKQFIRGISMCRVFFLGPRVEKLKRKSFQKKSAEIELLLFYTCDSVLLNYAIKMCTNVANFIHAS